ncbi:hypothetical protein QBC35DRAFT_481521 [Podospora australis]|uniref:Chromatin modification-related protein EAF6 n=1 Tax=Podospora australis TaxID=1536484 RepID=A0AAN6X3N2_9PEZI|nr:hypothetical protein QBC35DRAFT_481521 [Podospora australis]
MRSVLFVSLFSKRFVVNTKGWKANRNDHGEQAATEDRILQMETAYLENTPSGNIITGFDNYTKGGAATSAAAARKKTGSGSLTDPANRVFSRSSISYNPAAAAAAQAAALSLQTNGGSGTNADSTPASTPGPTPASGGATPTSGKAGGGGNSRKNKKSISKNVLDGDGVGESETDGPGPKKIRTNFGAVRK